MRRWCKRWCERCGNEISMNENIVQVSGAPYHFSCFPSSSNGDVTRFVRTRPGVYRVEYVDVSVAAPMLDSEVASRRAQRVWGEVIHPNLVANGRRNLARWQQARPTKPRYPYWPRYLPRPKRDRGVAEPCS